MINIALNCNPVRNEVSQKFCTLFTSPHLIYRNRRKMVKFMYRLYSHLLHFSQIVTIAPRKIIILSTTTMKIGLQGVHILHFLSIPLAKSIGLDNCKECVARMTCLYKNNGAVSCVGRNVWYIWSLYLPVGLLIPPALWWTAMCTRYFDTKLHGILPWADINRNCNTFLLYQCGPAPITGMRWIFIDREAGR